jgi:quercetin dioxygenase-like cupin family protein
VIEQRRLVVDHFDQFSGAADTALTTCVRQSRVGATLSRTTAFAQYRRERQMSTPGSPSLAPIALKRDEGDALWAFGGLALIKASSEATDGRVFVVEMLAPRGAGSPLHVHHREDEWFYVTDGELTFWVGGQVINAPAGSFVYGPRDIPHTFDVVSDEARFLLVTEPAGFETFMRAASQPAPTLTIPPPPTEPPDLDGLTALAAEYGVEILGPPGIPS